jgi:hypothetical protein
MRYRMTFVAGFATGFIVGARAGRERYEQIVRLARSAADNPAVQQAAGAIQAQASSVTGTARSKVSERLHDKVPWLRPDRDADGEGAFVPRQASHDGAPTRY